MTVAVFPELYKRDPVMWYGEGHAEEWSCSVLPQLVPCASSQGPETPFSCLARFPLSTPRVALEQLALSGLHLSTHPQEPFCGTQPLRMQSGRVTPLMF